ncbi:MAG: TauD/TfdA family dioxygenase, partial [Candidatus Tectomicrobia bacterium]
LWNAALLSVLPEASYRDVSTSDDALRLWLAMIVDSGVAMLRGVPAVSGTLTEVVALFGYIRETNYGYFYDVRTVVDPNNIAYTALPLSAHTDNPYRDLVPSLQLLHCLSSSDIGGDSTVVDGFCVANALRVRAPDKFTLLTTIPIRFLFFDKDSELEAEVTLITLNPRGEVVAVRFNGPTALPFDFDANLIEPYYDAYRTFGLMLESPEFQLRFKLDPGDLYIVDNTRVMHGRTVFSSGGNRHLQGCYADRDSLYSRLRVLNRTKHGSTEHTYGRVEH